MRVAYMALAALSLSLAGGAMAADTSAQEAKLAKALEGRTAGEPVDCIMQHEIRSSRIFDGVGILYELSNGTYYLNRPKSGASSLHWSNILLTDTHSNQLCSIDTVKLLDSSTRMQMGFVGLDKFVPYPRPRK